MGKQVAHITPATTSGPRTRSACKRGTASITTPATIAPVSSALSYIDDEGYEEFVDPGEKIYQENLDHDEYSRLCIWLQERGWLPLVLLAYTHEAATNSEWMRTTSQHQWIYSCDKILATVNPLVLEAICNRTGNLTSLYETTPSVKSQLDRYTQRGEKQATIYPRELTIGPQFKPMSIELAEELALQMRLYAAHAGTDHLHGDEAFKIDSFDQNNKWTKSMSQKEDQRFLKTDKQTIDKSRKRRWLIFARVLRCSTGGHAGF